MSQMTRNPYAGIVQKSTFMPSTGAGKAMKIYLPRLTSKFAALSLCGAWEVLWTLTTNSVVVMIVSFPYFNADLLGIYERWC